METAPEEAGLATKEVEPEAGEVPKSANRLDLSVIIPVFNEEDHIVNTVSILSRYLGRQGGNHEIIVSDDGSLDGSPGLVAGKFSGRKEIRLIRDERNRGKGAAVRRGVLAARGDIIVFTDADLAYPVETIGRCLEALKTHDVAIGSRNIRGAEIEVTPPFSRRLTGVMFKALVRHAVLPGFSDTQCGFKGFRARAAHDIFANCSANGFAFDVEVLALARLFGYSITEVPVRLQFDSSDSTINLTTDPLRMVVELMAIRRRMQKLRSQLKR